MYYFQNLGVVPRKMYDIELLLGAELNIMNEKGEVDLPDSTLRKLDIVIASIHICYEGDTEKEKITQAYLKTMEHPYIDIIGHPDDGRYPADYDQLAKKAKETGTLLEVNNSSLRPGGFRVNTKENAKKMLECCKKYHTMVVVGTDAHVDVAIADDTYAMEVLNEVDFPEELVANTSLEKLKASLKRNKKE